MAREELLIETPSSGEAVDLIDAFRVHGLVAGLADTPGTWDVAVTGSLSEIAPILAEELAAHGSLAAAVHEDGRVFVVEATAELAVA